MSDLPYPLRQGAIALSDDHTLNWVQDALREAADFIESAETAEREPKLDGLPVGPHAYRMRLAAERAERERLEHEAVAPETGRMAVPPGGAPHGEFVIIDDVPEIDLGPQPSTFTPDGYHGEGIVGPRPETATGGPVSSPHAAYLAEIKRLQHFIDEAFAHVIGRDCAAARIALTNARWGAPQPTEGTTDGRGHAGCREAGTQEERALRRIRVGRGGDRRAW